MVSQLHEAAQAKLGGRVKTAALSQPENVTVTKEEVDHIFDYLGIKNLMLDKLDLLFSELFATSAAYAGHGKGLFEIILMCMLAEPKSTSSLRGGLSFSLSRLQPR
jgi:hypothetical protein